jgi:protein PhnA
MCMNLEVQHLFSFSAEQVFKSFLNSKSAQHFLFRTPTGQLVTAEVNPEVGGNFVISEQRPNGLVEHHGTFVEIESNEKISFVFYVQINSDETSFVELFFKSLSGEKCEVNLKTELKPEYVENKQKFATSWKTMLENLDQYLVSQNALAGVGITKDSQGQVLSEGDSVKVIKDLKVKGSSMVVKRGTLIKKIHLISGNDEEVDCKVEGVALALETQWLVKA